MEHELLITIPEACRRLSIGRTRLYELLKLRVLPSVKIGSSRRIAVSDLDDFVQVLKEAEDGSTF